MTKKFFAYRIVKVFLLGLVFLLSSVFLVYYLNQYLYRSKAGASSATLLFLPNNLSLNIGQASPEIQLLLQFQDGSSNEKIDYLKVILNFPKDKLELAGYIDTSTSGLDRQIRVDGPVAANSSGQIIIELGALSAGAGPSTSTSFTIAKLKFRGKSTVNNGQITISDVQIVNNASAAITTINKNTLSFSVAASCERDSDCGNNASCQNNSCVCNSGYYDCDGNWQNGCESQACANPTNTPVLTTIPTQTPTQPSGLVSLNLKLKFQGILRKPADDLNKISVKVTIVKNNNKQTLSNIIFTANDSGIWTSNTSIVFNKIPPDTGYYILVKGSKHIQKKICDNNPTETYPGTYHCNQGKITLKPGNNNLDFSKIILLAGDLPEQDGIVNSYDISLVRNNLGKTNTSVLSLADINLDGIVDTQDYSLIIAALSIRTDEGEPIGTTTGYFR